MSDPVTKTIKESKKIHKESQSTRKAIEELNELFIYVNLLELMNKSGIIEGSSIWPLAYPI